MPLQYGRIPRLSSATGRPTPSTPSPEIGRLAAAGNAAALRPIPVVPYVVTDTHLRRVGKD